MNTIVRRGPISSAEPAGSLDDLLGSLKASVSYRTLEPRMAFDGAAATTAATVADQPDSGSSDASDTASHAADSDTAVADGGNGDAPVADDASAPDDGTTNSEILAQADAAPNSARTTIVFIDRNVENIEQIIAGIDASHEIVLLETDESGLDQIAAFLADRNDVESIHIVSHGETGTLYLGSDTITSANLDSFQADLAAIGAALSDDGDILIYGCDVASGTGGMAFIRSISEATGADVAASIDSTGGDEAGGDWVLEATAGAIDAKSLDNPMYAGLLSKTNTGAGGNTWNISGATATNSTDGITTTVNVSASGTGTWNSIANNTLATATAGNGLTAATFDNGALGSGSLNLQWNTTVATETATVTFTFSSAVTNPVLHLDRLGGFSGAVSQSNSSVWTLATAGATLTKVAGVNHFIVDSLAGTISRRVGDTTVSASEADSNTAEGTAAGSVRINGTFTTLTFTLRMAIPTGGTAIGDGLEIALAIDAPPIAANDTFTTAHDVPATINVRANDSDVRGDAINVTRVNGTSIVAGGAGVSVTGGVVTLNASGNLVFTPTANYSGAPSFTYTIADANGGTATATVSGTVTNATPVLDLDASGAGTGWTTTYTENGSAISIADLDAAITDTDDANIESGAVTLTNAQTGDRLLVGGSSATSGTIGSISWTRTDTTVTLTGTATKAQYAAAIQSIQFENTTDMAGAGQTTPRIINATVNDGHINSAIAVTTINIDLTPDPVNDTASGAEDTTISGNVLTNDSDLGTTPITSVTVAAGPTNGTLTTFNTSTGAFVYTPNANFNGTDTFTYTLTDADGDTRTATVTITVTPVNDAPLNTLPATIGPVAEDATLAITGVSVADIDSAALTTTVSIGNGVLNLGVTGGATVSGAGTGAITLSGTASQINAALATLTYTPTADYNGTATFQMVTSDGALSDTDSRTITISPVVDIANNAVSTNEDAAVTFAPLGNDSFENAGAVITAVAGSAISAGGPGVAVTGGVVTLDGAGNLTFTPTANFNGPSAFTYTVTSGGVTEQATITVTVNAINDAPTQTVPGAQTTAEDTVRVISGASVADVDGGTLTTTLTIPNGTGALSVITGGGATISGNGTTSVTVSGTAAQINAAIASITFTPLADYNGAANLTMATNDGTITTSNVIAMTVTPVADITNDAMSVNEDTAHSFNAITGTNGATADTFEGSPSVTSVTQPANGSVTFAANGAMTYTPGSNFSGTDTFTYTVTSGGVVETATVTITVNAVNDAPINTVPGAQTTVEDTALIFSAANGNAITVADVDSTLTSTLTIANGTLTLGSISGVTVTGNGTGTLTVSGSASAINAALSGLRFQPTADWNGSTSLSLSTSDGVAPAAVNTVAITASAVIDVASDTVTTAEDTARTFNVLGNDSFEGAPVVTSVTQPAHGVVSIGSGGNVTYTPAANYNGPDSFTYTVTSGGVTETTTVSLTVTPVNDAPTVGAASAQTSVDGAADSYNVGALFADLDGDALTFSASGLPAGLTINATTGLISGTVGNHASTAVAGGVYSVTVTAADPSGALVTSSFSWTVSNPGPVAANENFTGNEDVAISGNVLSNDSDPDGDALTVNTVPVSGPSNGSLTLNADGSFVYTPNTNFTGTDSFTYQVIDADGASSSATVSLFINPINDSPLNGVPTSQTTPEDQPLVFSASAGNAITVSDADSALVTSTLSVAHGTLSLGSIVGVTVSGNGTASVSVMGTPAAITAALEGLTYNNTGDYNGPDVLSIVSTDGVATTSATLALTVTPVADITADSVTTNEDASLTFNVLTGTNGASADTFEGAPSVTGYTQPANGSVTINAAGVVVYTPNANFNGIETFSYTVTSGGVTETTTVSITVNSVNDAPTLVLPPAQTGVEDVAVVFSGANGNQIIVGDLDAGASATTTISVPSGSLLATATPGVVITGNGTGTVTLSGAPSAITAALNGFRYTPVSDANGTVTMTVSTTDGVAAPVAGTIAMTLAPVVDIQNDTLSTTEDTARIISVLANDTFENAGAAVTSVTNGANGTVTINGNGTLTYTPNANFNGSDSFTYTVTSGGATETATVTVVVSPVNDPTTQTLPAAQTTNEDTALIFGAAGGNAITVGDIDGDVLTSTVSVTNGTLHLGSVAGVTVTGDGSGIVTVTGSAAAINAALDGLSYAPASDYYGSAVLSVTTTDGTTNASGTVALTVTPVVDIAADSVTTAEDTAVAIAVLTNDTFEGLAATVTSVTQGAHGTVAIGAGGIVTYTPAANYNGPDTFSYTVTSGGVSETTTVSVTVTSVNDALVTTVPAGQTTIEDANIVFSSANGNAIVVADLDGDTISMTLSATNGLLTLGSTGGVTVTGNGTGTVTISGSPTAVNTSLSGLVFAPASDYVGAAAISISASDGSVSTSNTIAITITPVADIVADGVSTNEDTAVTFKVLANDNFESAGAVVSSITQGASGSVSFLADGTVIYTPNSNFNGLDSFTYTVTSGGVTETTTVTVSVGDSNDVPTTTGLADRANLDSDVIALDVSVSFADSDVADALTYSATGLPPGLSINPATGIISGTLAANASQGGPYTIVVTASDGHPGGSVSTSFEWVISNPAPTAGDDLVTTNEDTAVAVNVLANDVDPDGDVLSVVSATAGNGTAVIGSGGTITYTPAANFNGTDTIVYQISDSNGGTSTATVTITVSPVNDAPTTTGLGDLIDADGAPVAINISSAFSDLDGDVLTYSVTGLPPGLLFNPSTGEITGTIDPSASSPSGDVSFLVSVSANDGNGGTATTTFTWRVLNIPPTSADDNVSTPEDTPVIASVLSNDFDPDNDALSITHINGTAITLGGPAVATSSGQVALVSDAFGNHVLMYTPNANFNGLDSIVYTTSDGNSGSDTATLTITVGAVNDAPTADALANLASSDSDTVSVDLSTFFHDIDAIDGDTLTFSGIGLPPGVSLNPVTGIISGALTANASQGGPYSVIITATDSGGATVSETFTWTVGNPLPSAVADGRTVVESASASAGAATGVLSNDSDPDGDALTVTEVNGGVLSVGLPVAGSAGGLFVVNANGSYTFVQNGAFEDLQVGESRQTAVSYTVSDGNGGVSVASLVITVTGVNDAPLATPLATIVTVDSAPLSLNAASAFTDVDGDALTFTATGLPAGLSINPTTGLISGTIDSSASTAVAGGVYTVTVRANDGHGSIVPTLLTIVVSNPAPIAGNDIALSFEDTNTTGNVLANDSDADGDTLTVTGFRVLGLLGTFAPGTTATIPFVGSITISASGNYVFDPAPNFLGVVPLVTYTVADADGATDVATLVLGPVTPINDLPTSLPLLPQISNDGDSIALNLSGQFFDLDLDPLSFSATGLPPGLTINVSTGVISGTIDHLASAAGPYNVTISATDIVGGLTSQLFTWTVNNPVPVGPVIADIAAVDGTTVTIAAGAGFVDPDADGVTFSATGLPAGLSINPTNGTISGTLTSSASNGGPASDGVYLITVIATDSQGANVARTFTYTVANPPPSAGNDSIDGGEDQPLVSSVVGNDNDPDADALTYSLVIGPTHGTLVFNSDGTFTYTPNAHYNATDGRDTFTYLVTDANGATATAVVTLTVLPVNDAPVSADVTVATPENIAIVGTLAASDPDGDVVSFTKASDPSNGTVVVTAAGVYTYTPNLNYNGPDSFTYTVSDGNGGSVTHTVFVNVTPVNQAPVAVDDTRAVSEDTLATGNVLGNDTDPENNVLFVAGASVDLDGDGLDDTLTIGVPTPITDAFGAAIGTLTLNVNGSFAFLPASNYAGPVPVVTYVVSDGFASDMGTLTLGPVTPVNDPPVANPDVVAVVEDTLAAGNVIGNDSDIENDPLTVTSATVDRDGNGTPDAIVLGAPTAITNSLGQPIGTLTLSASGSFTFMPASNYVGAVPVVTYVLSDGVNTASSTLTLGPVTPLDDPPVAVNDAFSGQEDGIITGSVTANDIDIDGDTLVVVDGDGNATNGLSPVTAPTHGTLVLNVNGTFVYTPAPNYHGTDSFSYRISDGNGGFSVATVALTVNSVNDAPTAGNGSAVTIEDTPYTGTLPPAVDLDGGTVTYSVATAPGHGSVVVNADGTYTYVPAADYSGTDSFTYRISDGQGGTATYTVTIVVTPVNDIPVVQSIPAQTGVDGAPATLNVASFVKDVDGEPLTFTATGLPPGLTMDPKTGLISGTLTKSASQGGPYSVSVAIDDGHGGVVTQSFVWTVSNPAPNAVDDVASVEPGKTVVVSVLSNDKDPDGDALTVTKVKAGHGVVTILADGSISYTPDAGFTGTDTVSYVINDGNGGTSIASVRIDVMSNGVVEQPEIFGFEGPEHPTTPPEPVPFTVIAQPITARGAVIDAVFDAGTLSSLADQLSADGAVLAAANGLRSLGGIGTISERGIVVDTVEKERARDILTRSGLLDSGLTDRLQQLPGFSLRQVGLTGLSGLGTGDELIIESIVRDRTLIVQISSTLDQDMKRVIEYIITSADGKPLPPWLQVIGGDLLMGEHAPNQEDVKLRVEARYSDGSTAVQDVRIDTATGEIQPLKPVKTGDAAPALFKDQFRADRQLSFDEIELLGWAVGQ